MAQVESMHWVVVADAARARIVAGDAALDGLSVVMELLHPESRMHARDLVTDQRVSARSGPGGAHAGVGGADPKDEELRRFASEIADAARRGRVENAFERLILVAPPRFLGLLRESLDKPTSKAVVASVAHDLTRVELPQLGGAVRRHLPELAGMP